MSFNEKYRDWADQELIAEFVKTGDNACVGELYRRYGHLVLGLCIKYLKNGEDASDAVMQIFGNLLKDLRKHKISFFKSWLYVYSKNFCLMELRKRQSRLKKEIDLDESSLLIMDFNSDMHLSEKEEQILLMERAITLLNHEQRTCIELFYLKRRSYTEISGLTGYSQNEVKSYIQNGKRNLKLKMEALQDEQTRK